MAVGTSISIGAMLNKAVDASLALAHFEAETGLSAQSLQAWQHAGEALGLTSEEVASSVASLNDQLAKVKLTGQGAAPYSMLGLNPLEMENAWDVIEQLRKIIKSGKVPPQLMSSLIKQMGLSGSMVKVLKLSNAEFEEMANRKAIISKDQIEKALQFNAAMKKLGQTITYLFAKAFAELAPDAIRMVEDLMDWLDENRNDIENSIVGITRFVGEIIREAGSIFSAIDKLVKKSVGWENLFKGVGAATILLNPFAAALTAVALALKEIDFFISGKGSMFDKIDQFMKGKGGGLISRFFGIGTSIGQKIGETLPAGGLMLRPGLAGAGGGVPISPESMIRPQQRERDLLGAEGGLKFNLPGREAIEKTSTIKIEQNITSNADANEVARISADEISKTINRASVQTPGGY